MTDKQLLLSLLEEPYKVTSASQWLTLQKLAAEYPYYASLHMVLARQAAHHGQSSAPLLAKAAALAPNRLQLRFVMEAREPGARAGQSYARTAATTIELPYVPPAPAAEENTTAEKKPAWLENLDEPKPIWLAEAEEEVNAAEAELPETELPSMAIPDSLVPEADEEAFAEATDELELDATDLIETDGTLENEALDADSLDEVDALDAELAEDIAEAMVLNEVIGEEVPAEKLAALGIELSAEDAELLQVEIDLSDLGISPPVTEVPVETTARTTSAATIEEEDPIEATLADGSPDTDGWPGLESEDHVHHDTSGEYQPPQPLPSAYVVPEVEPQPADALEHTFMLDVQEQDDTDIADEFITTTADTDVVSSIAQQEEPLYDADVETAVQSEAQDLDSLIANILHELDTFHELRQHSPLDLGHAGEDLPSAADQFEHELEELHIDTSSFWHEGTEEPVLSTASDSTATEEDSAAFVGNYFSTEVELTPEEMDKLAHGLLADEDEHDTPELEELGYDQKDGSVTSNLQAVVEPISLEEPTTHTHKWVSPELEEPEVAAAAEAMASSETAAETPVVMGAPNGPVFTVHVADEEEGQVEIQPAVVGPHVAFTEEQAIVDKFLETNPKISKALLEDENQPVYDLSAQNTVLDDEDITENLAQIMVKQGKIERAIEIYCKLILKNPEKTPYFASRINALAGNK